MINKYYEILNVNEYDSDETIKESYESLRSKYLEERFLEGEEGNIAAKKLTELENAYREICSIRAQSSNASSENSLFSDIEKAIREGDIRRAQEILDTFDERNGDWHYYQSIVFYKKNWINESKKQLEIALQIDPDNEKFKSAYKTMTDRVNNAQKVNPNWNKSGNQPINNGNQYTGTEQQLGGESCAQWCCDMIICNTLLNCCCNCR